MVQLVVIETRRLVMWLRWLFRLVCDNGRDRCLNKVLLFKREKTAGTLHWGSWCVARIWCLCSTRGYNVHEEFPSSFHVREVRVQYHPSDIPKQHQSTLFDQNKAYLVFEHVRYSCLHLFLFFLFSSINHDNPMAQSILWRQQRRIVELTQEFRRDWHEYWTRG